MASDLNRAYETVTAFQVNLMDARNAPLRKSMSRHMNPAYALYSGWRLGRLLRKLETHAKADPAGDKPLPDKVKLFALKAYNADVMAVLRQDDSGQCARGMAALWPKETKSADPTDDIQITQDINMVLYLYDNGFKGLSLIMSLAKAQDLRAERPAAQSSAPGNGAVPPGIA